MENIQNQCCLAVDVCHSVRSKIVVSVLDKYRLFSYFLISRNNYLYSFYCIRYYTWSRDYLHYILYRSMCIDCKQILSILYKDLSTFRFCSLPWASWNFSPSDTKGWPYYICSWNPHHRIIHCGRLDCNYFTFTGVWVHIWLISMLLEI